MIHKHQRFNMIKQVFLFLFFVSVLPKALFCQQKIFNEQEFFNRVKTSYYNMSATGV